MNVCPKALHKAGIIDASFLGLGLPKLTLPDAFLKEALGVSDFNLNE